MRVLEARDLLLLCLIGATSIANWFRSHALNELLVGGAVFTTYHLLKSKRSLSQRNLLRAFDGRLSELEVRRIVRGSFYEFCRESFPLLPSSKEIEALGEVKAQGLEHLEGALENEKGAILWESSGFGRRNLAKRILHGRRFRVHQVHLEYHLGGFGRYQASPTWVQHHLIRRYFERHEECFVAEIIYLPGSGSLAFTRVLLDRLKQGAILCVAGDGQIGHKLMRLGFLGQEEFFSTGMISLARMSGAPIIPMFCMQGKDGKTSLTIGPPIHIDSGSDRETSTREGLMQYIGLLESYIRKHPDKYRLWHFVGQSCEREERCLGSI